MNYICCDTKDGVIVIIDHDNMGVDTLFVILPCLVMQILTKIGFSIMASLNERFQGQSHTPDPAAIDLFHAGGFFYQPMRSNASALFT